MFCQEPPRLQGSEESPSRMLRSQNKHLSPELSPFHEKMDTESSSPSPSLRSTISLGRRSTKRCLDLFSSSKTSSYK